MQSYLKYREYYDRKAKAAPLKQNDFCLILQPIADHQGSKIPYCKYSWKGPNIVEKVLPNENYIVRKLNSDKTHKFCVQTHSPNTNLTSYQTAQIQTEHRLTGHPTGMQFATGR